MQFSIMKSFNSFYLCQYTILYILSTFFKTNFIQHSVSREKHGLPTQADGHSINSTLHITYTFKSSYYNINKVYINHAFFYFNKIWIINLYIFNHIFKSQNHTMFTVACYTESVAHFTLALDISQNSVSGHVLLKLHKIPA